ncbi:DUF1525 domain-containing protein [Pluralibacter gergoviae]|uniref:DUF1525 domain-containing protein n=1 Tax=Pluralibacter gergoviae TaxID=61647 RepID=UPI003EE327E7
MRTQELSVTKVQAVVFDDRDMVYGMTDVALAMALRAQLQGGSQSDKVDTSRSGKFTMPLQMNLLSCRALITVWAQLSTFCRRLPAAIPRGRQKRTLNLTELRHRSERLAEPSHRRHHCCPILNNSLAQSLQSAHRRGMTYVHAEAEHQRRRRQSAPARLRW